MSPELVTLEELSFEDLPLAFVRELFGDGDRFERALAAMLHADEVRLLLDGDEAPRWRWSAALAAARDRRYPGNPRLAIAEAGARRIVG